MLKIKLDDLSGAEIQQLLREHLKDMHSHSPVESCHALDLEQLRKKDITFWTAWENGELLGCGALKELDPEHGEIKSMRTVETRLRKGVASAILTQILDEAKKRKYKRLSLETGTPVVFIPARKLYMKFGFKECPAFGDYGEDPYSVFMTKEL